MSKTIRTKEESSEIWRMALDVIQEHSAEELCEVLRETNSLPKELLTIENMETLKDLYDYDKVMSDYVYPTEKLLPWLMIGAISIDFNEQAIDTSEDFLDYIVSETIWAFDPL